MSKQRQRAVAIILNKNEDEDKILLMHRNRKGRVYYVFPGGGIEPGETPEQACLREVAEETSLHVTLSKKLFTFENQGNLEHYFLISQPQGQLKLGGPELLKQSPENQYRLEWISLTELPHIGVFPHEVITPLLEHLTSTKGKQP